MKFKNRQKIEKQIKRDETIGDETKKEIKKHKKMINLCAVTIGVSALGLGLCSLSLTTKIKEAVLSMPTAFVIFAKTIAFLTTAVCSTGIVISAKNCKNEQKALDETLLQTLSDKKKREFEIRNREESRFER